MKEARYLEETYTDEYHTLTQTILIDLVLDRKSNGNHAMVLRSYVNPNLFLFKTKYLDINMDVMEVTKKWKRENM